MQRAVKRDLDNGMYGFVDRNWNIICWYQQWKSFEDKRLHYDVNTGRALRHASRYLLLLWDITI